MRRSTPFAPSARRAMRVVLDTNVVISALLWGGTPDRLIQAAIDGEIELATSPSLLAELRAVLKRPHFASRLAARRSSVEEAITYYARLAIQVSPLATPRVVEADPADDQVIAAALAAAADLVVSGDADLRSVGIYQGISIVSPAQAAAQIDAGAR